MRTVKAQKQPKASTPFPGVPVKIQGKGKPESKSRDQIVREKHGV
jgi:hypothetical protein